MTPQQFHDAEINGSIAWFHDTGWTVKLGDELNGFDAEAVLGKSRCRSQRLCLLPGDSAHTRRMAATVMAGATRCGEGAHPG